MFEKSLQIMALLAVGCMLSVKSVATQCTMERCGSRCGNKNDEDLVMKVVGLQNSVNELQQQLAEVTRKVVKHENELSGLGAAHDCADVLRKGHTQSGVYDVYLTEARQYIQVYCDMTTDGGGWLVFQRRQDGSVDFYRNWADYKRGFGNMSGEFWLGNDFLHNIVSQTRYTLRIDMEDYNSAKRFAVYSNFAVTTEVNNYTLTLGVFSGNAGDALSGHANHSPFSASDHDATGGCVKSFKGGWWYKACHGANLNGLYLRGTHSSYADGIEWATWHDLHYSLKKVDMKLRP